MVEKTLDHKEKSLTCDLCYESQYVTRATKTLYKKVGLINL